MHFSSSYYLQVIYRTGFLLPFFDFHGIYRLPFSIFAGYLQAPLFDLHVIYRLPFPISMLFSGSLFRFPCYLQAPFFDLHVIYRLPFSIYMFFTCFLHHLHVSLEIFTCFLHGTSKTCKRGKIM